MRDPNPSMMHAQADGPAQAYGQQACSSGRQQGGGGCEVKERRTRFVAARPLLMRSSLNLHTKFAAAD